MLLIREEVQDIHVLTEEHNGKKFMYLEGVFMQSKPNKNGRMYPLDTLQEETTRYINEKVTQKRAFGELGHPQGPQINLDRISHLIESLRFEGNDVIGKAKLVDTPMGKIAQGIVESGGQLGMSSRGLGSLKKMTNGLMEVQKDFRLVTAADIVAEPSAPDAWVNGIMENVEWYYDATKGTWIEKQFEQIVESVKKMPKRKLEESKLRLFQYFLEGASKKQ